MQLSSFPPSGDPSATPAAANSEADVGLYYVFIEEMLHRGATAGRLFLSPDFVEHGMLGDGGAHEFMTRFDDRRARFPDAVWTIELLVGVAGLVLCHATMTTPELSRRAIRAWETFVIRCANGKIAECWRISDNNVLND